MAVERVGFIGLGVMGGHMARHIAAAGYPLTVFDLNPAAAEGVKAAGGDVSIASSPRAVAEASDIVVTMLPSGKEVRETALGQGGLIEGLKAGSLLLDTSSAQPWLTLETAGRLKALGIAMVDAPVSGAEPGARAAELVFMVGGDATDIARVQPLLDVMGKQSFHLGPISSGHVMKSLNNLLSAATLIATTETLLAGARAGLDPVVMNDVLDVSTGGSWVSKTQYRSRVFNRKFDDLFKLDLMMKDMDIASRVAEEGGIEVPLNDHARALWRAVQAVAPPAASVSYVVRAMEERAGIELKAK